jgi:hypothetical protein
MYSRLGNRRKQMDKFFIATIARDTSFAFEMRFAASSLYQAKWQAQNWVDLTNEQFNSGLRFVRVIPENKEEIAYAKQATQSN